MNLRQFLSVALLMLQALFSACTSTPGSADAAAAVQQAHAKTITAFNNCDHLAFLSGYGESFTFTTSNTRVTYTTREALGAYLAGACRQKPSPQVSLKSQDIRFVGSTALVTGQYVFRIVTQGTNSDVTQNFTAALQEESGAWRMIAHHVSLAP